MRFVDFHNHLYDLAKYEDISNYRNSNIFFVSTAGNQSELEFLLNLKYKQSWNNLAVCAAVHPTDSHAATDFVYESAKKGFLDGIGETGLDYRKEYSALRNVQRALFEKHIRFAEEFSLPLVIHSVKAMDDLFKFASLLKNIRSVIFHSWAGNFKDAGFFLKNGVNAFFSFSLQNIKSRKSSIDSILNLDMENILSETDFPWQPLNSHIYTNPLLIKNIYSEIAALKGLDESCVSCNMLKLLNKTFFYNNSLTLPI